MLLRSYFQKHHEVQITIFLETSEHESTIKACKYSRHRHHLFNNHILHKWNVEHAMYYWWRKFWQNIIYFVYISLLKQLTYKKKMWVLIILKWAVCSLTVHTCNTSIWNLTETFLERDSFISDQWKLTFSLRKEKFYSMYVKLHCMTYSEYGIPYTFWAKLHRISSNNQNEYIDEEKFCCAVCNNPLV